MRIKTSRSPSLGTRKRLWKLQIPPQNAQRTHWLLPACLGLGGEKRTKKGPGSFEGDQNCSRSHPQWLGRLRPLPQEWCLPQVDRNRGLHPHPRPLRVKSRQDHPLDHLIFKRQLVPNRVKVKIPPLRILNLAPNSPPFTIRLLDHKIWHEFFALIEESFQTNIELKYLYILVSYMVRSRWMHMGLRSYFIFGLLSAFYYERRKQRQRMLS